MKFVLLFGFSLLSALLSGQKATKYVMVVHGGAGNMSEKDIPKIEQIKYEEKLKEALSAGYEIIEKGGSSVDAVTEAIKILEDSPLFNAGRGAVYTHEETIEHDASIMNGKDKNAGAVAGVSHIKNPILGARKVMENSPHVMFTGKGAELFAEKQGLEMADSAYFHDEKMLQHLRKVKQKEEGMDDRGEKFFEEEEWHPGDKFGTVGAVALDKENNLAAGTSTGGMTNKKHGRVGDSPIIGAGTYADNNSCAVSCTGHGEYFIRVAAAYDVAAQMLYKNIPLNDATHQVVMEKLLKMGGEGGLIAIDKDGNIATPFNTSSMFRGTVDENGKIEVFIFK